MSSRALADVGFCLREWGVAISRPEGKAAIIQPGTNAVSIMLMGRTAICPVPEEQ